MISMVRYSPPALVIAAGSVVALGTALVAQYGFGLAPCELCVLQRWPYVAAVVLAGLALALRGPWRRGALALAALALLTTAGIAGFHVGVEQHWWAGTSACGAPNSAPQSLAALRAQVMGAPIVRCDEVAFSLFGISMAGYNLIYAVILFGIAVGLMRREGNTEGGR